MIHSQLTLGFDCFTPRQGPCWTVLLNKTPGGKPSKRYKSSVTINQSHKSHNAPVPYPTMHHFVTEMCTCVHFLMHCGICKMGLNSRPYITKYWKAMYEPHKKQSHGISTAIQREINDCGKIGYTIKTITHKNTKVITWLNPSGAHAGLFREK